MKRWIAALGRNRADPVAGFCAQETVFRKILEYDSKRMDGDDDVGSGVLDGKG